MMLVFPTKVLQEKKQTFAKVYQPCLAIHAGHSKALPSGIKEAHLLPYFIFLLLWQVGLGNQLVACLEDITHTALVCCQLHHEGLLEERKRVMNTKLNLSLKCKSVTSCALETKQLWDKPQGKKLWCDYLYIKKEPPQKFMQTNIKAKLFLMQSEPPCWHLALTC